MPEQPDRTLTLVLDFLNTVDVEAGSDVLADPAEYRMWLDDHNLPDQTDFGQTVGGQTAGAQRVDGQTVGGQTVGGQTDLAAARSLRQVLRAAVTHDGPGRRPATPPPSTPLSTGPLPARPPPAGPLPTWLPVEVAVPDVPLRFGLGPDYRPILVGQDPLGQIAAATIQLAAEGRWDRVKICPTDDCQWAFYDLSKNQSRQWCSMRYCGNRAKGRTFRQRRTEADRVEPTST